MTSPNPLILHRKTKGLGDVITANFKSYYLTVPTFLHLTRYTLVTQDVFRCSRIPWILERLLLFQIPARLVFWICFSFCGRKRRLRVLERRFNLIYVSLYYYFFLNICTELCWFFSSTGMMKISSSSKNNASSLQDISEICRFSIGSRICILLT